MIHFTVRRNAGRSVPIRSVSTGYRQLGRPLSEKPACLPTVGRTTSPGRERKPCSHEKIGNAECVQANAEAPPHLEIPPPDCITILVCCAPVSMVACRKKAAVRREKRYEVTTMSRFGDAQIIAKSHAIGHWRATFPSKPSCHTELTVCTPKR